MADLKTILQNSAHVHFVGVGGSGMYPLVQILHAQGHTISGSDVNEGAILDSERRMGVNVIIGQRAENVHGAQLVVYSAAISEDNPERCEAQRLSIPCVERSVLLGYVAGLYRQTLAFAGTHGKTTASGMAMQILEMADMRPGAVIGGKLPLIDGYGKAGSGEHFIAEACEYNNTYHKISPSIAVLLNVDADHLEFFGNMDNLKASFRTFCSAATSTVIYNGDDAHSADVVNGLGLPLLSFGMGEGCTLRACDVHEHRPAFWAFTLQKDGVALGKIKLGCPGEHNIYNALAACAGCMLLGASFEQCEEGLYAFSGMGRRFELLGEKDGVMIVDDYAHHPAEISATLCAARRMHPQPTVWAVHQPFTYTRTSALLDDFAASLSLADRVVMTAIMGSREKAEDYDITTEHLAKKIPGSVWFETQREVADYVMTHAKAGDIVLTLGCGDIYKCAHMMLNG